MRKFETECHQTETERRREKEKERMNKKETKR